MNAWKAKPWAVLALISLAFNLFLGGLVMGRFFRPDRPPRDIGPIALFRASRDMDPGSREIIAQVRERRRGELRDAMRGMFKARMAAVDALCAEDFDEAKVREAFRVFRDQSQHAHDAMHESLIEVAKAMTPQQRNELRQALLRRKQAGKRGPPPRGSWGPFHDGPRHRRGPPVAPSGP